MNQKPSPADDAAPRPDDEGVPLPDDDAAPLPPAAAPRPHDDASPAEDAPRTETADLRVVVDRIEGRSVCGMSPGDYVEITRSAQLQIPEGKHFCMYALAAVLPLLPAKQRPLPAGDWLATDSQVACPDPEERLIMRIETIGHSSIPTEDLT